MKKVLILTAGFGEGHNAAARNLRDALEFVSDDVKVEVLDLFESSYGSFNTLAKNAYLGMVQYAPKVWGGIYSLLDNSAFLENRLAGFGRLKNALGDILHETQPDCVVSAYPVYAHVIQELYRDHSERPFRFITIVTDSITINSTWFRAPSDLYCVPNEATATVLKAAGVPEKRIRALGFPVSHLFTEPVAVPLTTPTFGETRRILYIINTGKKKAGKVIDRLLDIPDTQLTITVGRDAELKAKLTEQTHRHADRVSILGWTNQMPQLMLTNHLVIGKAGGASVQEAIAARCPMIINQVIPGQEEGNARLITDYGLGAVAERNREVPELVKDAFAHRSRLWLEWRRNLAKLSKPDASLRLAELVLAECETTDPTRKHVKLFGAPGENGRAPAVIPATARTAESRMLLCDFHIHTNYSDGKLSVPEVVDFYGRLGFDCICITDHLADPRRLIGKLARLTNMTVSENQLDEYFDVLERERRRAWRKYNMLVLTGIEFNKDGYTRKSSAHLLGIDLKAPIPSALDLPETIAQIHAQGGLAVASHPHIMKSEWGKDTLYLWENHEKFAPLIDAWEIANRNNIFDCVGMKRLPFLANSDFHKPKHIYSWKTLLYCEKNAEAIKECVRRNEHVSITLYREDSQFAAQAKPREFAREKPDLEVISGQLSIAHR
ncbi:MAG: UDP-N-acetylglucosamine:LPS N-acetylglucosamine transferase [Pedosphaera sp.]|nr:UDP-N-acetylglucosamine:LPS N-acetylglucosamine transferase [Pedosphaera sp.]